MSRPAARITKRQPGKPLLSIGFILGRNFTLSALSLFIDQLRLASDEGDLSRQIFCRWSIMSDSVEEVRASCGIGIRCTTRFVDPREFDYIVVVGGLLRTGPQVDDRTVEYLKEAASKGITLVGLCTGSFILTRAGLMEGRLCCVSWYHHQDYLEEFPGHHPVADQLYVCDGDRITCAGGGGTADLINYFIERHLGSSVAQKCRHVLLLDRPRSGSDAQPHPPLIDGIVDPRIRRVMIIMEQHLASPLQIAEIAARLQLSTRQLERSFQSVVGLRPGVFYRALRLRYAHWLLANTDRQVTDIALDAGFSDCAHFSRQFKAAHGFAPSQARMPTGRAQSGVIDPPFAGLNASVLAAFRVFD